MAEYRDIEVSGASLRNGRLYFAKADSSFFPADSFGDRSTRGSRGKPVEFLAGSESIVTDIRYLSDVRIGPRRSFAAFLKSIRAKEGAKLRVLRLDERVYRLEVPGQTRISTPAQEPKGQDASSRTSSPGGSGDARGGKPAAKVVNGSAVEWARAIFAAATPVIRILGLGGRHWKRNVARGARIGPWLQAEYEVLNEAAWRARGACLYMVAGSDAQIRYFGISRNGLKHRWRKSPAYDAETMRRLPENQLFHSQCWKHIEAEATAAGRAEFEVRAIEPARLVRLLEELGPPLSGFTVLGSGGDSLVAALERWFCNHRSDSLARWNVAMTA